ncbi:MAG: class I SAM-dependent DNA methyltransferase [Nocardioidaceae bacterium]
MRPNERARLDEALRPARLSAYLPDEYVGQESFMSASEIRSLAVQAGIGPGVSVLDLCCGTAGPGLLLTRELGCAYLGLDASPDAVALARDRAGGLGCRFEVSQIPPVPARPVDVVLLLETMLAFPDKGALLAEVAGALTAGGRFACTVEEGSPLTESERARMPNADTVWPIPLAELRRDLERVGLQVRWLADRSAAHRAVADSLAVAFAADAPNIAAHVGNRALRELLAAHQLWSDWLREGRVRKLAIVAEK